MNLNWIKNLKELFENNDELIIEVKKEKDKRKKRIILLLIIILLILLLSLLSTCNKKPNSKPKIAMKQMFYMLFLMLQMKTVNTVSIMMMVPPVIKDMIIFMDFIYEQFEMV